jgi:hypothetical protein
MIPVAAGNKKTDTCLTGARFQGVDLVDPEGQAIRIVIPSGWSSPTFWLFSWWPFS